MRFHSQLLVIFFLLPQQVTILLKKRSLLWVFHVPRAWWGLHWPVSSHRLRSLVGVLASATLSVLMTVSVLLVYAMPGTMGIFVRSRVENTVSGMVRFALVKPVGSTNLVPVTMHAFVDVARIVILFQGTVIVKLD